MREIATIIDRETLPMDITLSNSGERVRVIGFVVGSSNEETATRITIRHGAPNTTSEVFLRSILTDSASSKSEAHVTIVEGARGASARVETRALLLSDKARATMKPVLEILEPDVHASHAATAGTLDENQLFALESRGVAPEAAQHMLVWGFLKEGLDKISDGAQRGKIESRLHKVLPITNQYECTNRDKRS
jgi:Fe-S cluster assembly protein SufD